MEPLLFTVAQAGFILLTLIYFTLLVREFNRARLLSSFGEVRKKKLSRRIITGLVLWALFVSGWSLSGMMSDFSLFPFNVAPVLLIPLITCVLVTFSKTFTELLMHIPNDRLIRLQSFRFFVELMLWALFVAGTVPVQMTFEGRNLDILSGISAPVIAFFAARGNLSRKALIIWNILCLGLLINIVGTAILSMPVSFRVFHNEPSNTIVAHFPVSWLPGLLVPLAYLLHFLSLRQLLKK